MENSCSAICRRHGYALAISVCVWAIAAHAEELPVAPENWFERARGYEEARELQKELGADMILFIASRSPAGPTRRSRQVDNEILRHRDMREFLGHYVKVKLTIPSDPDTNTLAEERFRVQYGPRLFVVRPGGFSMPISLFMGEGDRRTLLSLQDIQRRIIIGSSPRYQRAMPVPDTE